MVSACAAGVLPARQPYVDGNPRPPSRGIFHACLGAALYKRPTFRVSFIRYCHARGRARTRAPAQVAPLGQGDRCRRVLLAAAIPAVDELCLSHAVCGVQRRGPDDERGARQDALRRRGHDFRQRQLSLSLALSLSLFLFGLGDRIDASTRRSAPGYL